jgi:hypothetical protein
MENAKQIFEALETIAAASKTNQKLNFYIKGVKFEFHVSYIDADEKIGNDEYIISSVGKWGESMNVEKITGKAMSLYTYNMFGKKVTEKVLLENITLEKK